MRCPLATLILASMLLLVSEGPAFADAEHDHVAAGDQSEFTGYVEGADRLEGRLLAPCCWTQTLDIHGSPASTEIRREIRRRLRAGEEPNVIEASLVARHGKKILAVPEGSPLGKLALLLLVGIVGAAFLVGRTLLRWNVEPSGVGPEQPKTNDEATGAERDDWDARLDEELGELD